MSGRTINIQPLLYLAGSLSCQRVPRLAHGGKVGDGIKAWVELELIPTGLTQTTGGVIYGVVLMSVWRRVTNKIFFWWFSFINENEGRLTVPAVKYLSRSTWIQCALHHGEQYCG